VGKRVDNCGGVLVRVVVGSRYGGHKWMREIESDE